MGEAMAVRFNTELRQKLLKAAERRRISTSEAVREAVEELARARARAGIAGLR